MLSYSSYSFHFCQTILLILVSLSQITEPLDFKMWQETMDAEFGSGKFKRLFRGPMWSGCDRQDVGDPRKVNIKRINDYANFACTAAVQ